VEVFRFELDNINMARVLLKKLRIKNLGPIKEDEIELEPFTYFVGRNNAGKSHYLKAVELLLTSGTKKDEIAKLQRDKNEPIVIDGYFEGVGDFTNLLTASNHKNAIEEAIQDGILMIRVKADTIDGAEIGMVKDDGSLHNPSGFTGNLLKVLPEVISIVATADTTEELGDKSSTALGKLKKEVMGSFFQELAQKTSEALSGIDDFLHSDDNSVRSQNIASFEADLKEEFMGEFSDIVPSVEFALPKEDVIAKEMKILLDDGHKSEVESKGHGLQRATLLALLKLLARKGQRFQNRPAPLFLIGELESFLHPYAQKELAVALNQIIGQYQVLTSTHSPFIITPQNLTGYRRTQKDSTDGTKALAPRKDELEIDLITRHLERRGNLEGLFADRVILIEGDHDDGFYRKLIEVFNLTPPPKKFTLFVRAFGSKEFHPVRKFYKQMGFDDISIICDLDYLFSNNFRHLLGDVGIPDDYTTQLRNHIGWTEAKDPSLSDVLSGVSTKGEPANFTDILSKLSQARIFTLKKGAPEMYYVNNLGEKDGWEKVRAETDLADAENLKHLMTSILV